MNILYHHRTQGHGAEGVHITGLIKGLEEIGNTVLLCSPPGINPKESAGDYLYNSKKRLIENIWKIISRNMPQIIFEINEIVYNIYACYQLNRKVKKYKVDIVYERYAFFLIVTAFICKKNNIPLIVEANEVVDINRARPLILKKIASHAERFLFKKAKYIVTVSSYLMNKIEKNNIEKEKIVLLPNGVDPDFFTPQQDTLDLKKELKLTGCVVIGFVGWIDPWDNLQRLINAFEKISKKFMNIRLLLIGNIAGKNLMASEYSTLFNSFESCKNIVHLKHVKRNMMPKHIALMDICVIPDSNDFGSPIVLFEYMACGKAVLSPNVTPINDVIQDGINGIIFDKNDEKQFQEKLCELLENENLRRKIGRNARKDIEERYNWKSNAQIVVKMAKE